MGGEYISAIIFMDFLLLHFIIILFVLFNFVNIIIVVALSGCSVLSSRLTMTQAALVTLGDQIRSDQKKKRGGGDVMLYF